MAFFFQLGCHQPAPFILIFYFHYLFCCHILCRLSVIRLFLLYRLIIISRRLSFLECDRSCRAVRQTVAEAVAEVLSHKLCLAVHHINGTFVASLCAQSAAIAFLLIYMDYLPDHHSILLACLLFIQCQYSKVCTISMWL